MFWSNSIMSRTISRNSCASMLMISLNCWIMCSSLIDWSESSTSLHRSKPISVYIPFRHSMLSKPYNWSVSRIYLSDPDRRLCPFQSTSTRLIWSFCAIWSCWVMRGTNGIFSHERVIQVRSSLTRWMRISTKMIGTSSNSGRVRRTMLSSNHWTNYSTPSKLSWKTTNGVNERIGTSSQIFPAWWLLFVSWWSFSSFRKQVQKRKEQDQADSTSDDLLPMTINLDTDVPRDQLRVIEQSFPDPSMLGDAVLIPRITTPTIATELHFAREQPIAEYFPSLKASQKQSDTAQLDDNQKKPSSRTSVPLEEWKLDDGTTGDPRRTIDQTRRSTAADLHATALTDLSVSLDLIAHWIFLVL